MLDLYLHDGAGKFTFVLRGDLGASEALQLEYAWQTASSILNGKSVLVDLSALARVDAQGAALLQRMADSGARFISSGGAVDGLAQHVTRREPQVLQPRPMTFFERLACILRRCCGFGAAMFGSRGECQSPTVRIY